jgi:formylmethanofuran dehydrogenase subunit D
MSLKKNIKSKDFELNVSLSYKVKNGSVKVSEKDLRNLGIGIVEEVVIKKVGSKDGINIMSFSDSHIKSGNVIMSVSDSSGLEIEEGDKVTIKKIGIENTQDKKAISQPIAPKNKLLKKPSKK